MNAVLLSGHPEVNFWSTAFYRPYVHSVTQPKAAKNWRIAVTHDQESCTRNLQNIIKHISGLHLAIHRTIRLTAYIRPQTQTLSQVHLSVSPIV